METMTNQPAVHGAEAAPHRLIEVEYLYLDLDSCSRCRATDHNSSWWMSTPYSVLATSVGISLFLHSSGRSRKSGAAGLRDPATVAPPI